MKLPLPWLKEYLELPAGGLKSAAEEAARKWDLMDAEELRGRACPSLEKLLGSLFTFAGFACEGIEGNGEDAVLELDVLANRPDCQCVTGLAREAAAFLGVQFRPPRTDAAEQGAPAEQSAQVTVEEPALCPRYTARIIRGVKIGPSPAWLQERLRSMGLEPRNNVVDVTNYVLFEMNQPLHAFDADRLAGRRILVRRARSGEKFAPLYGEVPPLTPETLVIADAERAVAVAGIIGGAGSEVTGETRNLLLESAYFDPANTRRTCRRLKVSTDSSYRFERGIDLDGVAAASQRAARLIVEVAGGQVAPGVIDRCSTKRDPRTVQLRRERLRGLYGAEVPAEEMERIIKALGGCIRSKDDRSWSISAPSWRGDLEREVDWIEEVARLHGYNRIPDAPAMKARIPPRSPLEAAAAGARRLLAALGYFECVTDSLVDPRWPAPGIWTDAEPLALHPGSVLREDHSRLRTCLLVSLLEVYRRNQDRRNGTARLFECGKVFLPKAGAPFPEERHALGLLDDLGFPVLADAVRRLPEALEWNEARLELRPAAQPPPFLTPESACQVALMPAGEHAGWLGLLADNQTKAFDVTQPLAAGELNLDLLARQSAAPRRCPPLPAMPAVLRDVALVVDENVAWAELAAFVDGWRAREPLRDPREPLRFLSVFRGKQVGAGKKSVAFSIVYRAADRSLTDEEVNAAQQRFVDALLKKFRAALRM